MNLLRLLEMSSPLLERLGTLHLVLLHLPIGFVVAAVFQALWCLRRPTSEGAWLQGRLLATNAVATLLTAGAGLLLAEQGNHPVDTLAWHRWAGVACAGLAIAAWALHASGNRKPAHATLAALLAVTIFAGHQGATLTHGEAATAWWRSDAAAAQTLTPGTDPVFTSSIQPILEKSCLECHGAVRPKGRLRLDSREAALGSGRSGKVAVAPGRPESSELMRRLRLPRDHEEAMPKGKGPGLSPEEITAFESWIQDGARW